MHKFVHLLHSFPQPILPAPLLNLQTLPNLLLEWCPDVQLSYTMYWMFVPACFIQDCDLTFDPCNLYTAFLPKQNQLCMGSLSCIYHMVSALKTERSWNGKVEFLLAWIHLDVQSPTDTPSWRLSRGLHTWESWGFSWKTCRWRSSSIVHMVVIWSKSVSQSDWSLGSWKGVTCFHTPKSPFRPNGLHLLSILCHSCSCS